MGASSSDSNSTEIKKAVEDREASETDRGSDLRNAREGPDSRIPYATKCEFLDGE
jgi:hypothetical protein